MRRRGFLGSLVTGVLGLFGVRSRVSAAPPGLTSNGVDVAFKNGIVTEAQAGPSNEASFDWLREQLQGIYFPACPSGCPACATIVMAHNVWRPEDVRMAHVSCGAGTCPPGPNPDAEGWRAVITRPRFVYHVIVKPDYLGCTMSTREPDPGETWTRGRDLADGKRTRDTWTRILRDIRRHEEAVL